ncbi:ADC synthase [Dichotomocladium elegans]|nr:ADC synthase [Dichotomocladium elegans]
MLANHDDQRQTMLKTLIIDNYDSYTFNLLQLCSNVANIVVIRNDQFSWDEFKENVLPHFHNIIISPGPGRPERASDFGICAPLIEAQLDPAQIKFHRPIFGICLGHQGIAHIFGGKVTYAPRIMHGRLSQIHTLNDGALFESCSSPFWAVRYHSLVVDKCSLPDDLVLTAYCEEDDADVEALRNATYIADRDVEEGVEESHHFLAHPSSADSSDRANVVTVMGFQHKSLPLWGVQFHPESVSTEYGAQMISNFAQESYKWYKSNGIEMMLDEPMNPTIRSLSALSAHVSQAKSPKSRLRFVSKTIEAYVAPEHLFERLCAEAHGVSWLDSSRKGSPYSTMSILAVDPAFTMTYSTLHRRVDMMNRHGHRQSIRLNEKDDYFRYVSSILNDYELEKDDAVQSFCGGLVGYFGYEMKRESITGYTTPKEQRCSSESCNCSQEPDAGFQFVDRFWTFDLKARQVHLCCLIRDERIDSEQQTMQQRVGFDSDEAMNAWLSYAEQAVQQAAETVRRLSLAADYMSMTPASSTPSTPVPRMGADSSDLFVTEAQHDRYLDAIKQCIHEIHEGESYEICLTTRFRTGLADAVGHRTDLWRLYSHHLRKNNPAPFSALLHFPTCDMSILSSSPERFLSISATGVAEMKPIKGTMARALECVCPKEEAYMHCEDNELCLARRLAEDERRKQALWQDVKERAENLMIVDLIRNDLAQVCRPSTVRVPKLMHVETYEKVHHLVSTIRGVLHPHVTSVEAVKTCFPPGSMTGAPKLRSVQLLDQLEGHRPRGVYSGCLGYFSLDGSADFSVVIRTAVATNVSEQVEISVGAGGAVTFLSDPEQEWRETLLKTKSVAPSIREFLS